MNKTQLAAFTDALSNVDWYEIAQQKALLEELNAMLATSPEYREAVVGVMDLLDRLQAAAEAAGLWEQSGDEDEEEEE